MQFVAKHIQSYPPEHIAGSPRIYSWKCWIVLRLFFEEKEY